MTRNELKLANTARYYYNASMVMAFVIGALIAEIMRQA